MRDFVKEKMDRGGTLKIKMGMVGAVWGQVEKITFRNRQVSRSKNLSIPVFIGKLSLPSLM